MKSIRLLLAAGFIAVAAACASSGTNASSADRPQTYLVVDNQALLDMTIYVLRGAQQVRLGTATGLSKTRLLIPPGVIAGATSLRFRADPIGSNRAPISEEVTVMEGDEIGIRIPPA